MKNLKTLLLTTAVAFTFNVQAHDPSMHAKKAPAKADCSSYNKMMESGEKMDMNDPVMLAMMKKCKNQKPEHDNADGHHDTEKAEGKCGDMSDGHHDQKTEDKCGDKKSADQNKKAEMKCGNMGSKDGKSESKCGN